MYYLCHILSDNRILQPVDGAVRVNQGVHKHEAITLDAARVSWQPAKTVRTEPISRAYKHMQIHG